MATRNVPSPIENLLDRVTKSEHRLNISFLKTSQEVDNTIGIYSEIKTELRKHLLCSSTNHGNVRNYTWISREKILETLFNSNHYSVVKDSLNNNVTPIVICSCDGGMRSLHSVIYSVASFSFGKISNLYGCTNVRQSVDSTHSEIRAVYNLLTQALTNHLDKVVIVIDNLPALNTATLALTTTIYDSLELQRFVQQNPESEPTINLLHNLTRNFRFIGMIWQKSHISDQINNIFQHLNHHADTLATNQLDEVLDSLKTHAT